MADCGADGLRFDGQWDENFVHPIRDTIIRTDDPGRNMYAVGDAIEHGYNLDTFGDFGSSVVTAQAGSWDGMDQHGSISIAPYRALSLSQ